MHRILMATLILLITGGNAFAGTIDYISDSREVHAYAEDCYWDIDFNFVCSGNSDGVLSDGSSSFMESLSLTGPNLGHGSVSVNQDSTLEATGFSGTGLVSAFSMPDDSVNSGYSTFDITFTIDAASDFTLSGSFYGYGGADGHYELVQSGGTTLFSGDTNSGLNFDESGSLAAGEYRFLIETSANLASFDIRELWWSVNFELLPVPEPSTALLFSIGLMGLAVGRHRN